jgi:hypothetical protein
MRDMTDRDERAVEKLAQKMYEASSSFGGTPWISRGWALRKFWLTEARQKRERGDVTSDGDYFWQKLVSLFRSPERTAMPRD